MLNFIKLCELLVIFTIFSTLHIAGQKENDFPNATISGPRRVTQKMLVRKILQYGLLNYQNEEIQIFLLELDHLEQYLDSESIRPFLISVGCLSTPNETRRNPIAVGRRVRIYFPSELSELYKVISTIALSSRPRDIHLMVNPESEIPQIKTQLSEGFHMQNISGSIFGLTSNLYFLFFHVHNASTSAGSGQGTNRTSDSDIGFSLWQLYHIAKELIFEEMGNGHLRANSANRPLDLIGQKLQKRKNFRGQTLRITVSNDSTGELEAKLGQVNGRLALMSGSAVSLFWDLKYWLNFTYDVSAGDWINRFQNGSLHGITYDQLKNGSADLQLSLTSMLPYRAKEFKFLQPTYYGGINAFFLQPPSSTFRDIYIVPFQIPLWGSLFSTWALILISIQIISFVKSKTFVAELNALKQTMNECLIWAMGATCQQSWYNPPYSASVRIVHLCGTLTGFLTYIAYAAAIVSTLSIEVIPINSFGSLLDSSFHMYAANDSSTMQHIIQNLQKERNRLDLGTFVSVREGVKFAQDENTQSAFLVFSHHFYRTARLFNATSDDLCKLSAIPVNSYPFHNGMILPKNSPYHENLNHGIMRIKEVGLNFRYMSNYKRGTSTSCVKRKYVHGTRSRLGIKDVFTAYIILILGYSSSFLFLLCERIVYAANSSRFILK